MTLKLLTEYHLEFLSLKGGCTDLSESALVKMPHCWKSHVTLILFCRKVNCVKLQNLRLRKKQSELANSLDQDEMSHIGYFIWIYTVCPDLYRLTLVMLNNFIYYPTVYIHGNCLFFVMSSVTELLPSQYF